MAYPTRKIGKDGTPVSAIGFGVMGISAFYWSTESDEERLEVLDTAFQNGCTFWDSANIYGDSEELIGKWFKQTGKHDQIFLATKYEFVHDRPTKNGVDGSPQNVEQSFSQSLQSLQHLGVTHIDLFYLHHADPEIPIEVTVGAMAKLVDQGKVRYLSLSECSADTLRHASAVHPIAAVQLKYPSFKLGLEKNDVLNTARELGIKIIAYSQLGRGLLTGRYKSFDDFEEGDFRWSIPRTLKLAEELEDIGKAHNVTAGQVALAWHLAQGEDVIPIPGTKKIKYSEENLAAAHVRLTPKAVQRVRMIAEKAVWKGGQY